MGGPIIPVSWSGLERVSPTDVITRGSQQPLSCCVLGHIRHVDEHPAEQPSDPRANLLLTSEF